MKSQDYEQHYNQINFAPVCGIQIYEQMKLRNDLGFYHLLLAHDILNPERKERYKTVFQNHTINFDPHRQRIPRTIILDNSVVELKTPVVDIGAITEAAKTVEATVIVLPDIYEDAKATIESCQQAYYEWESYLTQNYGSSNWNVQGVEAKWSFMMVPQGKTVEEFAWCAEQFKSQADFPLIGWWGIPRNLVEHHGTREHGLNICRMLNNRREIHMLGFSDNIIDDMMVARRFVPRGIDSAVPVRAGTALIPFSMYMKDLGPRKEGWLEDAKYVPMIEENIKTVEQYLNG